MGKIRSKKVVAEKNKAMATPQKQDYGRIIQPSSYREYLATGLTPSAFAEYLRQADVGDVRSQAFILQEMESKDITIMSELQKRKLAVVKYPWVISPLDESSQAQKVAEFCEQAIKGLVNFHDDRIDMLDALGKGVSFNQIGWDNSEGDVWPTELKYFEPWHFRPDPNNAEAWRLLTMDDMVDGIALPDRKFLIHKYKAISGSAVRAGLIRILGFMYIFKNFAIKDWLTFLDLYGIPLRIGRYEPGTGEPEKSILRSAVMNLGTDAAAVISKQTEIEIANAISGTTGNPHQVFVDYIDKQIRIAINGQTLTSDIGSTGSYAAASTHKDVMHELTQADARALDNTIRWGLLEPIVFFNFGPDAAKKLLPVFTTMVSEARNLKDEIEIDRIFISELGAPVVAKDLYDKYGWKIPEAGETTLQDIQELPQAPGGMGLFERQSAKVTALKKKLRAGIKEG